MKTHKLASVLLFLAFFACKKDSKFDQGNQPESIASSIEILIPEQINAEIKNTIKGNVTYNWIQANDTVLWSAIVHGGYLVSIGYGDVSFSLQKNVSLKNTKEDLLNIIRSKPNSSLKKSRLNGDILLYEDATLNYMYVQIESFEALQELRKDNRVRYIEPVNYDFFGYESQLKSSSGCNIDAETINTADYTTITPGCLLSWVFLKHNIYEAWAYSTGKNITVGLIDTGVSSSQSLLGASFNDGYSSGRYIYKYGTYEPSIWPWNTSTDGPADQCGHGTAMAATIAGPRNDNNMPVGVAYNCNLVAYRATSDVVLDGNKEQKGVANALTALANRSDVKIISMSIGHIISIGSISDAMKYAYSKGKLIFCAGGTSTEFTNWAGVIFPASMAEAVAVTGITDGSGYTECAVCHKGDKIDFAVVMQRESDSDRTSPCLGFYENTKKYVGGSSVSTATMAGIAALVWGAHPDWTRDQVLTRLKQSASLYTNKSSDFGYGVVNASLAVR